ncbi:hypothetical protein [Crocosphaera sp.]|uniref:hypothetical protein n=1 Tax=Crocosphaera sp. TaxID=2729996 RepID=UPI002610FB14|nr:hypothetical protein [Crocosphaera sp.]MDJ0578780.1 hypothetical protein [Crocosphaera sp.]
MNDRQIFIGFCDLLTNENLDSQAIQDLSQLSQTLKKLKNDQSDDAIADAIVDWCANHQPLGESLRMRSLRARAIRHKGGNQADQEQWISNISLPESELINEIEKKIEETQAQKSQVSQENNN